MRTRTVVNGHAGAVEADGVVHPRGLLGKRLKVHDDPVTGLGNAKYDAGHGFLNHRCAAVGHRLDDQFSRTGHRARVLDLDLHLHRVADARVLIEQHVLDTERGFFVNEGVLRLVLGLTGEDGENRSVVLRAAAIGNG